MLTISNQIKEMNPDWWYSFKTDDTNVEFNMSARYGVNEDTSYIINSVTSNYLIPRYVRPTGNYYNYDPIYTSNQLAESEFLVENDSSLQIGRNSTKIAGLNYYENVDYIESIDDILQRIDSNETREYLFQFRPSNVANTNAFLQINYGNDNESFVPIVYDFWNALLSFPLTKYYSKLQGNYEIWGGDFDPVYLPPDDFTGADKDRREMTFKIVNPTTGKDISDATHQYIFDRNSTLNSTNSEEVPNIFLAHDIYTPAVLAPNAKNRVMLEGVYVRSGGKYYRLKKPFAITDKLVIPKVDQMYFIINTPYLFNNRSYEFTDFTGTNSYEDMFMELLGFKFYYRNSDQYLRLYDTDKNVYTNLQYNCARNQTKLFYIKTTYEKYSDHNPQNSFFHYKMIFHVQIVGETSITRYEREYRGGLTDYKYKGIEDVSLIKSFDSYKFSLGFNSRYNYSGDNKTISCRVEIDGPRLEMIVPSKVQYISLYSILTIDNFCYFLNRDIVDKLETLFITSYPEDNSILDRSLIQYWGCESLRPANLRTSPNKKENGVGNSSYDLYSYMNFVGPGKVKTEKIYHRVLKGYTYFDGNVTGNSNNFASWSNNNNYTINLWFKSDQKTRGVILCDMSHETVITAGVYIGVSNTGTLEIGFNRESSRIYPRNITDNEWHMITIVVTSDRHYLIYLDGEKIDDITSSSGIINKSYTSNYQIYFMGHPLGNNVRGSLSRVGFYGTRITPTRIKEIYDGDIEHRIYGTILASNMPFATEVRFFDYRTGKYINSAYSNDDTGAFLYRNYEGMDVHLLVVNNDHQYGTIQVMGPLTPTSKER